MAVAMSEAALAVEAAAGGHRGRSSSPFAQGYAIHISFFQRVVVLGSDRWKYTVYLGACNE